MRSVIIRQRRPWTEYRLEPSDWMTTPLELEEIYA